VAILVARNANEVVPMAESVVSQFVFVFACVWQKSGFTRREYVFEFSLLYKFYKCCTLNANYKDNAAINCVIYCSGDKG
jgi:hypothetical protein